MNVLPLGSRVHRAVFWISSFIAVNFLMALAGCGGQESAAPSGPGQSTQSNPEYQKMQQNAARRGPGGGRPGARPSAQASGMPPR